MHWLAGDPSKRKRYQTEPTPPEGKPTPPNYLDAVARAEWDAVTTILDDMGLLSGADRAALEMYCVAYSRMRHAQEQVAKFGSIILSPNKKYPMQSPYASELNTTEGQCRRWLQEFGLTPASRARMSLPVKEAMTANRLIRFIA